MKMLKKAGFFPSTPSEHAEAELRAIARHSASSDEEKVVAYLNSGYKLMVVLGLARDLLDPTHPIIKGPNVLTDGEWAWTEDLAHYVKSYHLRIPDAFLAHMLGNDWRIPDDVNLADLRI